MLAAYFDLKMAGGSVADEGKQFGRQTKTTTKKKTAAATTKRSKSSSTTKHPKPASDSMMTSHAKFQPLPAEKRVPRPAEEPGQAWQALEGSGVQRDDDVAAVEWWGEDEEAADEDDDDVSVDFEFDSLDPTTAMVSESLSSSVDDAAPIFFSRRSRLQQPAAVYTGPQLCFDDDEDFD